MMLRIAMLVLVCGSLFGALALRAAPSGDPLPTTAQMQAPATIGERETRSAALFGEMGKVILSPRCLNCHPRSDRPTQGDDMHPHNPPVVRGLHDRGAPGLTCRTCHGAANVDFADGSGSVPGNPQWRLAPRAMAWQGTSLGDICRQIKDVHRNGGKTLAQLIEHNAHDDLVGWGWHPGTGRAPAPGTQAEFGALTRAWVASGARCPA